MILRIKPFLCGEPSLQDEPASSNILILASCTSTTLIRISLFLPEERIVGTESTRSAFHRFIENHKILRHQVPTFDQVGTFHLDILMVYYFQSTTVDPPAFLYVGKDKVESGHTMERNLDPDLTTRQKKT